MIKIMGILSFIVNAYMMIIFFRILLSWFPGMGNSRVKEILCKITDPYLDLFRGIPALRTGFADLSPIAALGVLSLVNRVFGTLERYGTISIGIILAMILQIAWGAVSFFLGFIIIVLILRFIGVMVNPYRATPFWNIVDDISSPVLYRISRFLFKDRITNQTSLIIVSILAVLLCSIVTGIIVSIVTNLLVKLPV